METVFQSLINQYRKNISKGTETLRNYLKNIPTSHITEINELIYAGVKWICYKISVFPKEHEHEHTSWIWN